MTGDTRWMELPRSQLEVLRKNGKVIDGEFRIPIRFNENGWHRFSRENPSDYVHLWFASQDDRDWDQIERLVDAQKKKNGRITDRDLEWAYFFRGRNPGFAERALRQDIRTVLRKVAVIQDEHGDPETWVDNKWINVDPILTDNLVRFSIGGLPIRRQGEMLHSQVRYFDGDRRCSGLPPDVAALVTRIEQDWIEIEVINLNAFEPRQLIVQGGAYGEHRFLSVDFLPLENLEEQADYQSQKELDAAAFAINLAPGSGSKLKLNIRRYANQPSYDFPWKH
jgi:hypothetical protein